MSKDIQNLLDRSAVIRDAFSDRENTAMRVGSLLWDMNEFIVDNCIAKGLDLNELQQFLTDNHFATQDWVLKQVQGTSDLFDKITVNGVEMIRANYPFWSVGNVAAYGDAASAGGSGSGSGGVDMSTVQALLADYLTVKQAAQTYQPKGDYALNSALTAYLSKTEAASTYAPKDHTHSQYLTAHQTIYSLSFEAGSFSAGSYNPATGAATLKVPTSTDHISEGANKFFTDARAVAALKSVTDALGARIVPFEQMFEFATVAGRKTIKAKFPFWSVENVAAYGEVSAAGSGSSGGVDMNVVQNLLADYLTIKQAAQTYQPKGDYALNSALTAYLSKTEAASTYAPKSHTHAFSAITATPTTLAGYGITDAKIANGTITLGANSITPLTAITKAMVEGVLTGNITSHTHSQYALASALSGYLPLTGGSMANTNKVGNLNADLLDGYHESSFVRDRLLFDKADYQHVVILLWKTAEVTTHRLSGQLFTYQGGSARYNVADIDFWYSRWSSGMDNYFKLETFGQSIHFKLVTCNYNGEEWWGLQYTGVQAVQFYFRGTQRSISFTKVHYYTSNTQTVVNAEVNGSIVDRSAKLSTFMVGAAKNALTSDNVASASKLADDTTFTAWGQPFFQNGVPKSVTGALSGVPSIANGEVKMSFAPTFAAFLKGAAALPVYVGGLLVSNLYDDGSKVPTNGIYSKGNIHTSGSIKIGEATFSYDSAKGAVKVDKPLYSEGNIAAYGDAASAGGSSSGGGVDLSTINNLLKDYLLIGTAAQTYSRIGHSHSFAEITATPTTIAGYGITDAYTKTAADARFSPIGHEHTYIKYRNERSSNAAPFDASYSLGVEYSLKLNSADSLKDGGDYHGVMSLRQWSDNSGGPMHQLGFTSAGNIHYRYGSTAWSAWKRLAFISDLAAYQPKGNYAVLAQANNFCHAGNEWTTIATDTADLDLWLNWRLAGGSGSIYQYHIGDGTKGGHARMVARSFVKDGGTADQFLKANGTVDSNSYALASHTHSQYALASALSGYLPLSGGAMANTNLVQNLNADLLDGVHYRNILERAQTVSLTQAKESKWYRVAKFRQSNAAGVQGIIMIGRTYNSPSNESYTFSISLGYNGDINFTQLSGQIGGHLITKIRVTCTNSGEAFVDFYCKYGGQYTNTLRVTTIGALTSLDGTEAATELAITKEYATHNGMGNSSGFNGNATTATKLQTARKIWGQLFDGSAAVAGALSDVTNITMSGVLKIGDATISYVNGALKVDKPFYSTGNVAAYGEGASGSGGSGSGGVDMSTVQTLLADYLTTEKAAQTYQPKGAYLTPDTVAAYAVTALGISGNDLTWTKNGAVNKITVPYAATASRMKIADVRGTAHAPNYWHGSELAAWFNNTGMPRTDWYSGLTFIGWTPDTYSAWQIAACSGTGADPDKNMYFRVGRGTAWESWQKVLTDANYTSIVTKVGTATVGASNRPVYLNAGVPTACAYTFGNASGNAALSNGTLCANLNADMLDGWHKDDIRRGALRFSVVHNQSDNTPYDLNDLTEGLASNYNSPQYWKNAPTGMGYGCVLALYRAISPTLSGQLAWDMTADANDYTKGLYWRIRGADAWGKWHQLAFSDSNIASATKLQTARKIWGETFDGTADVTGALSNVSDIAMSGMLSGVNTIRLSQYFFLTHPNAGGKGFYLSPTENGDLSFSTHTNYSWNKTWLTIARDTGLVFAKGGIMLPYTGGAWITMATRTNQLTAAISNTEANAHSLFCVKSFRGDAVAFGGLGNSIGFYGFTKEDIESSTNRLTWQARWNAQTGNFLMTGTLTAGSFIKDGGTASQFLKADGSVDSNAYALASALGNYLPLAGGTMRNTNLVGNLNADLLDGHHGKDYAGAHSYNFPNGFLVKLNATANADRMISVHILGNTFRNDTEPIDTVVQFYNYHTGDGIIGMTAMHNGFDFGAIRVFNYGGYICLWFQQTRTSQSFVIRAYDTNHDGLISATVTNAAVPASGVTRSKTIIPVKSAVFGETGDLTIPGRVLYLGTTGVWFKYDSATDTVQCNKTIVSTQNIAAYGG